MQQKSQTEQFMHEVCTNSTLTIVFSGRLGRWSRRWVRWSQWWVRWSWWWDEVNEEREEVRHEDKAGRRWSSCWLQPKLSSASQSSFKGRSRLTPNIIHESDGRWYTPLRNTENNSSYPGGHFKHYDWQPVARIAVKWLECPGKQPSVVETGDREDFLFKGQHECNIFFFIFGSSSF